METATLMHAGSDPLMKIGTSRGYITSLHALAIMGGFTGGAELTEIMRLLFDVIQSPQAGQYEESFSLLSPARFGSLRLASTVDPEALVRKIKSEKLDAGELERLQQRELVKALNRKDVTGNAPMHLAFVMVKSLCVVIR